MGTQSTITLRGVRVHNLKSIDLDLPREKLIVICGRSGSGKSSLAIDTLYAEGQRRYIETFSAHARQFLEQLEKPEADRIDGIPPSIAVTSRESAASSRATLGTATEVVDYLRLLYAEAAVAHCEKCGKPVRRDAPDDIRRRLEALPERTRYMIAFSPADADEDAASTVASLKESGFQRVAVGGKTLRLDEAAEIIEALGANGPGTLHVIVDRLAAGSATGERLQDSIETALEYGGDRMSVFIEGQADDGETTEIDGRAWTVASFSRNLSCETCGVTYPTPEPRLFSFNSPLGACPHCEGFGNVVYYDIDRIVPNSRATIRDGAIAPWNTPAYQQELRTLVSLAEKLGVDVDVPFSRLPDDAVVRIMNGCEPLGYGGLQAFFETLEQRKYKMHIRVFLSRWRSYRTCPECDGSRLRPQALAFRVGDVNLAEMARMRIEDLLSLFGDEGGLLGPQREKPLQHVLGQVRSRLRYLEHVGLKYLTLDRPLNTLSTGEQRRAALTSALGSGLVNMLYVLDEPSVGLHPRDTRRLLESVRTLRDRSNTVVIVEHEEEFLRAADHLIEIGPEAGDGGGQVVYQGLPDGIVDEERSLTGDYLAGRRGVAGPSRRRVPEDAVIRLEGARGHNLKDVSVEFPLGTLTVVTGVSGAGKSSLVTDTLHPAICRRFGYETTKPLEFDAVLGTNQIDDIVLVDQSPIGRTPRSVPVTYVKAFDEIRAVFRDTVEAKTRNYKPSHFSFNVDGGRCDECKGEGYIEIDMQFLANVYMRCPRCGGSRYQREILDVQYRGRNIAEVLDMSAREAFHFFRGKPKVQKKLKCLMDVGLDYVQLGQPANTLSGGESQRLRLAAFLATLKKGRCLFVLDEPTTGLHFADIVQLLDCFRALLDVGHSFIVVEHNLQLIRAADHIIDLGPDAGAEGGKIVAQGTPEEIAACKKSVTGRFLAETM